jgi:hypothetical protein
MLGSGYGIGGKIVLQSCYFRIGRFIRTPVIITGEIIFFAGLKP